MRNKYFDYYSCRFVVCCFFAFADITVTNASGESIITFTDEEIGTIVASGEKPFEEVTVTVTVNEGGPKGGISGPLYEWRDAWEQLTE